MKSSAHSFNTLQKISLSLMGVLMMITFVAANVHALLWQSSDWLVSTVLPAVVIDLTNKERTEYNAQILKRNSILDDAAKQKAIHMAENEYFAHYSPDGVSPWHWFKQVDYTYAHAGENLAIHFTDSAEVVDAWMDSPAHKANIVNGTYSEIGVGTAKGKYEGYDTVFVVQLFGTPAVKPELVEETITSVPVAIEKPTPIVSREIIEEIETQTPIPSEPILNDDVPLAAEPEIEQELAIYTSPSYQITDDVVIIESPTIATSSGLAIASIVTPTPDNHTSLTLGSMATQPNSILQFVYFLLGGTVIMLLVASIVLEMRRFRMVQVAYSLMLLAGMGGLWYAHLLLTKGAVIV